MGRSQTVDDPTGGEASSSSLLARLVYYTALLLLALFVAYSVVTTTTRLVRQLMTGESESSLKQSLDEATRNHADTLAAVHEDHAEATRKHGVEADALRAKLAMDARERELGSPRRTVHALKAKNDDLQRRQVKLLQRVAELEAEAAALAAAPTAAAASSSSSSSSSPPPPGKTARGDSPAASPSRAQAKQQAAGSPPGSPTAKSPKAMSENREAWFKAELERAVLINNLAVIGKLKKGDKIRTDSPRKAPRSASGVRKPFDAAPTQLAIDAWGPLQGVARRFREEIEGNVDHRVGNVAFVANTVDSAVAEIRELQKGIRRLTDHDKNAGRTMEDNGTRRMSPDRRRSTLRQMSSRLRDLLDGLHRSLDGLYWYLETYNQDTDTAEAINHIIKVASDGYSEAMRGDDDSDGTDDGMYDEDEEDDEDMHAARRKLQLDGAQSDGQEETKGGESVHAPQEAAALALEQAAGKCDMEHERHALFIGNLETIGMLKVGDKIRAEPLLQPPTSPSTEGGGDHRASDSGDDAAAASGGNEAQAHPVPYLSKLVIKSQRPLQGIAKRLSIVEVDEQSHIEAVARTIEFAVSKVKRLHANLSKISLRRQGLLNDLKQTSNLRTLLEALRRALEGLKRYRETYAHDPASATTIDAIVAAATGGCFGVVEPAMVSRKMDESKAQALFKRYDTNGDGLLDVHEFSVYLQMVYVELEMSAPEKFANHSAEVVARETAEKCFAEADLNGDGVLTFHEFKDWLQRPPSSELPGLPKKGPKKVSDWKLEAAAEAAKAAEDAHLEASRRKEIHSDVDELAVGPNGRITEPSARKIFDRHDCDGNQALDMTEFTEFLRSMFEALKPHSTSIVGHRTLSPTDLANATAGKAFADADLNHDGRLTFDEFRQWLCSAHSPFGPSGDIPEWRQEVAEHARADAEAAAAAATAAATEAAEEAAEAYREHGELHETLLQQQGGGRFKWRAPEAPHSRP